MESPRPVPRPVGLVVKNGSKIRGRTDDGNALPGVLDLHHHLVRPPAGGRGAERQPAARLHRVQRVEHERHEHLDQLLRVPVHGRQSLGEGGLHHVLLVPLMVLEQEERVFHHGVDRHRRLPLPLGAAEVEQPVHDARAPVHFLLDDLEVLLQRYGLLGPEFGDAPVHRRHARADGGERIVDLVHDAGGELPDGGELLALHDLHLDRAPLGHVLADGDDVGDAFAVESHRDLGRAEVPYLAALRHLEFHLLDGARLEDAVELRLELRGRLPGQHLEEAAAHRLGARDALRAGLALAVPHLDAVVAIHHVQADRQAVDDERGEAPLLLDLA